MRSGLVCVARRGLITGCLALAFPSVAAAEALVASAAELPPPAAAPSGAALPGSKMGSSSRKLREPFISGDEERVVGGVVRY